ncbi:hypothetical protein D3C72_1559820 [compost metagenome]
MLPQPTGFIEVLRYIAAGQDLPAERYVLGIDPGTHPDLRGAVGGEGVVELWLVLERIHVVQVLEKQLPAIFQRSLQPIEIDLLGRVLAEVGAQANDVAFIGDHVEQFVLAEETLEGGIAFAFFLARLDGDSQMVAALEGKAEKGVGNRRPHPIGGDQVDAFQLAQVEGFVVPGRGVVGFAAVVEVADVMHGDPIAFDGGVGQHRHIRLPIALVGRLDPPPPGQQPGEQDEVGHQSGPAPAANAQSDQRCQRGKGKSASQAGA